MLPSDIELLQIPAAPAVLPDGSRAIVSVVHPRLVDDEYTGGLWTIPLDESGGGPRPLTRGHRDTAPDVSADGRWVAFLRAEPQGKPQVYVVESSGGEPIRLTDAQLGASGPRFSPDGTRIAYLARVPEPGRYAPDGSAGSEPPRHITELQYRADGVGFVRDRPQHLFVVDVPDSSRSGDELPAAVALTTGDVGVGGARWLPSGDALVAVSARHGSRESDLRQDAVLVEARPSGDPQPPVPLTDADAGSTLGVEAVLPSADGTHVWLLASDLGTSGREFVAAQVGLYRVALDQGAVAPLRLTDAESIDLSTSVLAEHEGDALVASEVRGAVHLLRVAADGSARTLLDGAMVVSGVAVGGDRIVVTAATPSSAGEVFVVDPAGGGASPRTDLSAPLRGHRAPAAAGGDHRALGRRIPGARLGRAAGRSRARTRRS